MTARFLKILKEVEANAAKVVLHKGVLLHGPFWYSVHNQAIMNRYNDVLYSNVKEDGEEIAKLLTDVQTLQAEGDTK